MQATDTQAASRSNSTSPVFPLRLKTGFTAFIAVLTPVYRASWMPPSLYLVVWFTALAGLLYFPAHTVLNRIFGARPVR
jgi:hypothetical protein